MYMPFFPNDIENLKEGIISYGYIFSSLSILSTVLGFIGPPVDPAVILDT